MGVVVLANPACAHCVQAVDALTALAEHEGVPVAAIDVTRFPEEASRWGAAMSPVVVFDDKVAYAGLPPPDAFRALAAGS